MIRQKQSLPHQAVILAAGQSSRFSPFNSRRQHKSATELMGKPLIVRTVEALKKLKISDIFVVHSPQDNSLPQILAHQGVRFVTQEKPRGMGDALLAVKPQLNPNQVLVINPQQINLADHLTAMAQAKITNENVVLFSQPTTTPEKYGLLELNGNRVTSVVEKPTSSVGLSNQRLLGIYLLTDQFLKLLAQTEITKYQLEKTLNTFARNNRVLAVTSSAQTCTLKYAWDLFTISEVFFEQFAKKPVIHRTAQVHPTAIVEGPVIIEEDAKVYEYAIIKGPCYIGRHTVVGSYCKVRSGAVLEEGAQLQSHAEVKHSLIGENTRLHSGFIGDSIIGENVRIGAGFITANRRFDRKTIRITVDGKPVDTGLSAFGALVGDNTSLGIHSGTNPGTVIPANSKIMPGTILPAQK